MTQSTSTTLPYTLITERPVPQLIPEQLAQFTFESIHAQPTIDFDPAVAVETLVSRNGTSVIGADFGGDKGLSQRFDIVDGALVINSDFKDYIQSTGGEGYIEILKNTEEYAKKHNLPVGISWGAPLDGTQPVFHPKANKFLEVLVAEYGNDFKNITPSLTACTNDGPAGLISAAVEAYKQFGADNVIFSINGGGLGMAVLSGGKLYATEAGHVASVPELNVYGQVKPCGVFGAMHVCVETLGANKAGIEAQWQNHTGEYMRARNIEDEYKAGNVFAGDLYDNSAWVVSHMIAGTAQAFNIDLYDTKTAVVGHGGAFKFPAYGDRVRQILTNSSGKIPQLIMTKDFGSSDSNACLDGAAIAAAIA